MADNEVVPWWRTGWIRIIGVLSALVLLTTLAVNIFGLLDRLPDGGSRGIGKVAPTASESHPTVGSPGRCSPEPVTSSWAPQRTMFTLGRPAVQPSLNSIADNKVFGDERAFVRVQSVTGATQKGWCTSLHVEDGDLVWVEAFIENSASDSLVDAQGRGEGRAEGVRLSLRLQDERATLVGLTGVITSDNTLPQEISASAELEAVSPFRLDPVEGSPKVYTKAYPDGASIGDEIFSRRGVLLGSLALDGGLPPGYEYAMYVYVKVRVTVVA